MFTLRHYCHHAIGVNTPAAASIIYFAAITPFLIDYWFPHTLMPPSSFHYYQKVISRYWCQPLPLAINNINTLGWSLPILVGMLITLLLHCRRHQYCRCFTITSHWFLPNFLFAITDYWCCHAICHHAISRALLPLIVSFIMPLMPPLSHYWLPPRPLAEPRHYRWFQYW